MNRTGIRAAALAAFAVIGWTQCAAAGEPVQTLRGADAAAVDQAPAEKTLLGKRPGRQQVLDRSFDEQPPLISHALENFDEITPDDNQCLSCHDEATFEKKQAPMIGKSHLEPQSADPASKVDRARWFCTQCHVPQHDAPPLVDNEFRAAKAPAGAGK
jgi:cytochrome c-type protein NapB